MSASHVLLERLAELPELAAKAHYRPNEFAKLLGISLRTLERQCHQDFGIPPEEALDNLWCNKAQDLLQHEKIPKEINDDLACRGICNFYRKYKKTSGSGLRHRSRE